MEYMKKVRCVIFMLKKMTLLRNTPGEIYPLIGAVFLNTIFFSPFIIISLLNSQYAMSFENVFLVVCACIACGFIFFTPSYFVHKKYALTLLYKYVLIKTILGMLPWSLEAFFTASLFVIFTPFPEYRNIIAIAHIVFAVGYLAMLVILFLIAQDKSRDLYYKRRFGVLFVDPVKISLAESLPTFVGNITCGVLFPYMAIIVVLIKTKSSEHGLIFLATLFMLLGIVTSILLFKAVYRLIVILPRIKQATGEDVFADVHNFLDDNPERVQKLLGISQKNSESRL